MHQYQTHQADLFMGETEQPPGDDVVSHVAGWFRSVRARIHVIAELAVAEVKLVALGIAAMCFLAAAAALMLFSAWALAVAAAITIATQHGISPWVALIGFACAHALAGVFFTLRAFSISKTLTFAATRQQLSGKQVSDT
jgi:hypothetical protein